MFWWDSANYVSGSLPPRWHHGRPWWLLVIVAQNGYSVCDGYHGNRNQDSWPVDSQLAHAARRPHVREELVKDLDDAVGVFGSQEQGMDHDSVAQLGAPGAQDRLTVEQRPTGLLLDRGSRELTGRHVDSDRSGNVDGVADLRRLAVARVFRCLRGGDDFSGHQVRSCLEGSCST